MSRFRRDLRLIVSVRYFFHNSPAPPIRLADVLFARAIGKVPFIAA